MSEGVLRLEQATVLIADSVHRRFREFANAPPAEVRGFLVGHVSVHDACLNYTVTTLSATRRGKQSLRFGQAPRDSIGWFHGHATRNPKPSWRQARTHYRLFVGKPALLAVLASGEVVVFHGFGRRLVPVSTVKPVDALLEHCLVAGNLEESDLEKPEPGGSERRVTPDGSC